MRRIDFVLLTLLTLAATALVWFFWAGERGQGNIDRETEHILVPVEAWSPVRVLLPVPGLMPARIELGRRLFRDKRLSGDLSLACVDCHDPVKGGADGRKVSQGIGGALGSINAPTVFNSAYNLAQFWDGRVLTLEDQAAGPIHNSRELGSNWGEIIGRLKSDQEMLSAFDRNYPDGLTAANIANALATYERSLTTLNSRFDHFLAGDAHALANLELEGYRRFEALGCVSCHQGMLLGGNMFQRFGVMRDYFANRQASAADLGRYNVTGRDEDRHVFKVPSLRNVALTAPYFHDGSAATLEQAVLVMGRYQLGRELSRRDIDALVAFLKTLTGEIPE